MIEIVQTAPLMTVQDAGRPHWRHMGVPATGMMDNLALESANLLLCNPANAAGLEITFGPAQLRFTDNLQIVLITPSCVTTWLQASYILCQRVMC
jgi:5-oxoprolinase (ATP-hydrolysing) subunit C